MSATTRSPEFRAAPAREATGNLVTRAAAAILRSLAEDRAARDLASLDDRTLADIGIPRGDIRGALRRARA